MYCIFRKIILFELYNNFLRFLGFFFLFVSKEFGVWEK